MFFTKIKELMNILLKHIADIIYDTVGIIEADLRFWYFMFLPNIYYFYTVYNVYKQKRFTKVFYSGFLVVFHIVLLIFVLYILLFSISTVLPIILEMFYKLWLELYYILTPLCIIVASCLVILVSNPMYALLALISVFLTSAIVLIVMKIQFLAFIYIIIYIGAIAILFLFVIMLFNLRSIKESTISLKDYKFLNICFKIYVLFGLKMLMLLGIELVNFIEYTKCLNYFVLNQHIDMQYYLTYMHWDILLFGNLLYTEYRFLFLLSGLILLIAMVGSIVLALTQREND